MINIKTAFKRWNFLRKVNKAIEPFGAKATFQAKGPVINTLQINIGKHFTHIVIGLPNMSGYLLEEIKKQIKMESIMKQQKKREN